MQPRNNNCSTPLTSVLILEWRSSELYTQAIPGSLDQVIGLEMLPNHWPVVIHPVKVLQEPNELQQLCVTVIVIPALNRDTIVDVVAVCMRGVVH